MRKSIKFMTAVFAAATVIMTVTSCRNIDPKKIEKKPLKVLAIGNSFSICVGKEMPKVARDLGCPLDFCSLYIGGCTLDRHAANLEHPEKNYYLVTWDYVSCKKGEEPFKNELALNDKKRPCSKIGRASCRERVCLSV